MRGLAVALAMGATAPYGDWNLQTGMSGVIATPGHNSARCYSIPGGRTARIRKWVNLDDHTHIVLQGWFRDTIHRNRSMLGLAGDNTNDDNSMIRIGATGAANYQVQYYDGIGGGLFTVDTGLPVEEGWHFMRLDISYTPNPFGLWAGRYRVWNAAQTVEKTGDFAWWFNKVDSNYVTVGAPVSVSGTVAWDDIKVGSITDVGEPPSLPGARKAVGLPNRSLHAGGAVQAGAGDYQFKTWGWVSPVDVASFDLDDGSGAPVRVYCPGHGLSGGQYASACGIWNSGTTPEQLEAQPGQVHVLN